jgi:hypothetical protein
MSLNDYLSEVVERHGEQHFVAAWLADSWSSLLVPLLQGRVEDRVRKHELQLHLSEFVQKHSMAQGALGVESRRRQELEQTTKRAQEQVLISFALTSFRFIDFIRLLRQK